MFEKRYFEEGTRVIVTLDCAFCFILAMWTYLNGGRSPYNYCFISTAGWAGGVDLSSLVWSSIVWFHDRLYEVIYRASFISYICCMVLYMRLCWQYLIRCTILHSLWYMTLCYLTCSQPTKSWVTNNMSVLVV